jgi:hypothetical protein
MTGEDFFLILDPYARHRVFKHSLTAVHQPTLEQALTSILTEAWLPVSPQLFT